MCKPILKPLCGILCTLAFIVCFSVVAEGQVITGVNPNSGNAGQTVNLIITGSGTNFTATTGAFLKRPGWTIPAASFTANSNTNLSANFNLPPGAQLGPYDVGAWGATKLSNGYNILASPGGNYGYISGKVVLDSNSNCIQDANDTPESNRIVEILPGPYYASTSATGEFGLWVPLGNYSVQIQTSALSNQGFGCPATGSYPVSLTVAGDSVNNRDFYLDHIPPPNFGNLKVWAYTSPHRPGFIAYTRFVVYNTGNQPMSGYTLTGTVSGSLIHQYSIPSAFLTTGSTTMTWNLPTLNPGDVIDYFSYDSLPPSIALGTSLPNSATITPSDNYSVDNSFSGYRIVSGAYDPNDKQVWNADGENADGIIAPNDSLLQYLIRCQNTGTDTAFNVYIRDTLDANLDVNTLQVTDASHAYQLSVSGPGFVQFTFPNILLVDSATNEAGSHAYIEYTIERKQGLPVGTQIDNTAHIYFDFNQPIVTNTVSSLICPEINVGYTVSDSNLVATFTDTSSGTIVNYLWDFGDGFTSTSPNPVHTYATSGAYNICLVVTNNCGRVDSTCQQVGIGCQLPVSAYTYTANITTISFNNQSSTNAGTSWFWDFGDGNSSTQENPQYTYSTPGTYSVCLIVSDSCGSVTSCQSVSAICPVSTAAFAASNNLLAASFTDQSTTTTNITGWFWDFGDGTTSTQQNPQHVYATPGTYTVCLTVSDTCGSDSSCQSVNVSCPIPNPDFSATSSQLTTNFTDQSTSASTITGWLWDFGDGNTSTQQNPQHSYAGQGSYTVCLTVFDSCGSDSECLPVNIICPVSSASFTASSNQFATSFMDQSTAATTISGWFWDFGDGNFSSLQNPQHTYTAPGTYTVCLTITDACGSDSTCQTVNISCPAPTVAFAGTSGQLTSNFIDLSSTATTISGWFWDFGDGTTSSLQNPQHTYPAQGTYTVCLTVTDSCGSDSLCQSVTLICPAPTAAFSPEVIWGTVTCTDQSSSSDTITDWFWDFGDGNTSTQQNPFHNYGGVGTFNICLIATDACGSDTSCQMITTLVGIEDQALQVIDLYPNPTKDAFTLDLEMNPGSVLHWSLFDGLGRLIEQRDVGQVYGSHSQNISLAEESAGIYFLQIVVDGKCITKKIVKE